MKIVNFAPPRVSTGHARRLYGKRLSKIVGLRQILFAGLESFLDRLEPFSTLRKPNAAITRPPAISEERNIHMVAALVHGNVRLLSTTIFTHKQAYRFKHYAYSRSVRHFIPLAMRCVIT